MKIFQASVLIFVRWDVFIFFSGHVQFIEGAAFTCKLMLGINCRIVAKLFEVQENLFSTSKCYPVYSMFFFFLKFNK